MRLNKVFVTGVKGMAPPYHLAEPNTNSSANSASHPPQNTLSSSKHLSS